jgi:hypothetical protein
VVAEPEKHHKYQNLNQQYPPTILETVPYELVILFWCKRSEIHMAL